MSMTPTNIGQWLWDVHFMMAVAWEVSPDGERYLGTFREQMAARQLDQLFKDYDARAVVQLLQQVAS